MGMTNHTRPNLKSPPLRRGTACLACRKRKSRCDGAHPVCKQCVKSHREDQCVYGDAKRKSRTQQLREKVTTLQDRVYELEYETNDSLSQPYLPPFYSPDDDSFSAGGSFTDVLLASSSTSTTSSGSPSSSTLEFGPYQDLAQPYAHDLIDTASCSDEFSPLAGPPSMFTQLCQWNPKDPFSTENKKLLVDIFIDHPHQCWFDGGQEHPLEESVRHPALMNAVYLLGCYHVKQSTYFTKLESVYLNRALQAISSALGNCDRLVDVARASALLSVYFYSTGRVVDGYRHSFSAARLAVGLGLHQIHAPDMPGFSINSSPSPSPRALGIDNAPIPLLPASNSFEIYDRVSAFWQVFMVDHCWSAASGLPTLLPDTMDAQAQIRTPWPALFPNSHSDQLSPRVAVSIPALKVKAALLYERSIALSSGRHSPNDPSYWHEVEAVGNAVKALHNYLPSVQGYVGTTSGDASAADLNALFVNTLVLVCTIHVQCNRDPAEGLRAAQQAVSHIRQLSDMDYEYLDPLFAVWWHFIANTYIASIRGSGLTRQPYLQAEDDLSLVLHALKALGEYVPLAVTHAQQIEEALSIFRDVHIPSPFVHDVGLEYQTY